MLLSLLAHTGSSDSAIAGRAFAAAATALGLAGVTLLPATDCRLAALEAALDRLADSSRDRRRQWLQAAVRLVESDEVILRAEQALLHPVAEVLDCPLPASATLRLER